MAQSARWIVPTNTDADQPVPDHVAEAREIRRRFLAEHGDEMDGQDWSPQAFFERSIRRADIREILTQLATS